MNPSVPVALFLLAGAGLFAAQPPQPPVFSATTNLVLVDFVVTGKGDALVGGLSARDFVVKEDGKPRPIVSFAAFPADAPVAAAGPEEVVVEPFPTEPPEPRREPPNTITVLFVDDGQMSPSEAARLKPALKSLISEIGDRNGALALIAPWAKITMAQEVEGNRATFEAAVDRIVGRRVEDRTSYPVTDAEAILIERGDSATMERVATRFALLNPGLEVEMAVQVVRGRAAEVAREARIRREDAYGVLIQSLDWLARKPGRHGVVMVSGGFAYDPDDATRLAVVTRSLRANAPIHFLDARGLEGLSRFQGVEFGPSLGNAGDNPFAFAEASEGSVSLAADTGGLTIQHRNDLASGFTRVLDTMTTYYVIGYEPPEHKKAGFRKIKVEVRTRGLKVLARSGYFDEATDAR